jgi:hypothetical protein
VEQINHTAAAAATVDHDAHAGLLDDLMARVAPCFARLETRLTCRRMVNGLLSELEDYNCWTLAEAAGHGSPCPMQHRYLSCRIASMIWSIFSSDIPSAVSLPTPGVIAPWLE